MAKRRIAKNEPPSHPLVVRLARAFEARYPGAELGPPPSEAEIAKVRKAIGVVLPESFWDLYRWKNGSTSAFYRGLEWNRVESCLSTKQMMDGIQKEGYFDKWMPGEWWNEAWVPFLDNHSYDMVVIDTKGCFTQGVPGQVLWWSKDSSSRAVQYESFDRFLESMCVLIEEGADPVEDVDTESRAWKRINRGYPKERKARPAKTRKPPRKVDAAKGFGKDQSAYSIAAQFWAPEAVGVNALAFDGARLAFCASYEPKNPTLGLIDPMTGAPEKIFVKETLHYHALEFLRDGRLATVQQTNGGFDALVYSIPDGAFRIVASSETSRMYPSLSFDAAGERFTFTGTGGPEIHLPKANLVRKIPADADEDWRSEAVCAMSPDGKLVASAFRNKATLWSADTTKPVRTLEGEFESFCTLSFSPDGKLLAGGGLRWLCLWDVATGKPVHEAATKGDHTWFTLAFSPDSKRLAGGGYHGLIRILDLATGEWIWETPGDAGRMYAAAWSPDSKRLWAGFENGAIVAITS